MHKTAIFQIDGGIGKHILFTAVLDCYKKKYPNTKIIVVSAWPEVFLNNSQVDRVFKIGNTPNFYKDYIYGKDVELFVQEPYKTSSHITKKSHLIKSWCDMIGVQYNEEMPKICLNFREREISKSTLVRSSDKPILIFQPFGGPGKEHQETPYSWTRDIHPVAAQMLVNILSEKYEIFYICYDLHPALDNCTRIDQILQKKVLFGLLENSQSRLLIDSSLQHAAAALGLKSTVVWVATQPEIFGYNLHTNIKPLVEFPTGTVDSYLYDYNFYGSIYECPYEDPSQIFDIEAILKTL